MLKIFPDSDTPSSKLLKFDIIVTERPSFFQSNHKRNFPSLLLKMELNFSGRHQYKNKIYKLFVDLCFVNHSRYSINIPKEQNWFRLILMLGVYQIVDKWSAMLDVYNMGVTDDSFAGY